MPVARMVLTKVVPEGYRAVAALERYAKGNVDPVLFELVKLRASMVNGCAFCIDMHSTDALKAGELPARLFGVAAWWETPLYTSKERVALAVADAATKFGDRGVPDDVYAAARAEFDER